MSSIDPINSIQIPPTQKYDYIIAGAGCAGLSLAVHLIESGVLDKKKLLIIDKEKKVWNDRTWCFWETVPGIFESIVCKRWSKGVFHSPTLTRKLDFSPFEYKMIRGIDFYQYCFEKIEKHPNIDSCFGKVDSIQATMGAISISGVQFLGDIIFNSILFERPAAGKNSFYLLQHFKGWLIETENSFFNPDEMILMDFRLKQENGTTFGYVLPVSEKKALVEYTLFSERLLDSNAYDEGLKNYLANVLQITTYDILEEETGAIPMTNHRFPTLTGKQVNIGTAGGMTRASTGYTFHFIQKHSAAIVRSLQNSTSLPKQIRLKRSAYFDDVLLNVLVTGKLSGEEVFTTLFRKNKPHHILKFLNSESSLLTDLMIISTLPTAPFLKAGYEQI